MWELLYETFWDRLEHFCFNLCRDEARAEDLTQEVFVKAYECSDFWSEGFQQKAWLVTVARNEALKYRRSLKAGCVIWHVSVASKGQAMPASSKTA